MKEDFKMPKKRVYREGTYLNPDGMPVRKGVYRMAPFGNGEDTIEVYQHPKKGLCVFREDDPDDSVDDATNCHSSVQFCGIKFLGYLRPFPKHLR